MTQPTWREAAKTAFVVESQERTLAACLRAIDAPTEVRRLTPIPSADVAFEVNGKLVLVERKAASDLLHSWIARQGKTTHLQSQVDRMRANGDVTVLAIEGWFGVSDNDYVRTVNRQSRLKYDGLMNLLYRLQCDGVRLQFSVDTPHTAHRLVSLRTYLGGKK